MYVCGECGERAEAAGTCRRDGQQLAQTADPLLGTMVGRYRLTRVIGEGGMGRVYAAMQPDLGSRVAIKVVADKHAHDPVQLDRFFAEARAVNLIRHENIVSVIDLDRLADGRPVIVMELIEGQTLRAIVRAGYPPIGGVVQLMIEVLGAIAAAHAIGIVHRDLKPDNILVTAGGRAKVLDFGIAKLANELPGQPVPHTGTGVVMGTPEYMAPEQINGGTVDARCDIYAVGVVLFEAVTRQLPFAGLSGYHLLRAHVEEPPPSPRTLRPELPEPLEHVIMTALAKQRGHRFENAHAMANALHAAASALSADQWRPLTPSGRMFPRSSEPPAPLRISATAETGPVLGIGTRTVPDRPAARKAQPAIEPTAPERPTAKRISKAAATRDELRRAQRDVPPATAREDRPRRRSRSLVPALAAVAGGGMVAAVVALRMPSAPSPAEPSSKLPPPIDHFDPIASLPRAQEAANKVAPGAVLSGLSFFPLFPSGLIEHASGVYMFASPTTRDCIAVTPRMMTVSSDAPCSLDRLGAAPKCTFAQVWARALPGVTTSRRGAIVTWGSVQGRVMWSVSPLDSGFKTAVFPDDCGVTAETAPLDAGVAATRTIAPALHKGQVVTAPIEPHGDATPEPGREDLEVYADANDYDPAHFDPGAYLANAKMLARKIVPDLELVSIESDVVMSNGMPPAQSYGTDFAKYRFSSPGRAKTDHDTQVRHPCVVDVEVDHRRARATYARDEPCGRIEAEPRCTFAQVWAKARADGIPANQVAEMIYVGGAWTHNPSGYMEAGELHAPSGIDGPKHAYRDECAATPHASVAPPPPTAPVDDTSTGEFTAHLPGDPKAFDVVRYTDAARELARKLESYANLSSIECVGEGPTGFTSSRSACTYEFWSETRAHAVHDREHQPLCEVEVAVQSNGLVVIRRIKPKNGAECATVTIESDPECTLDRAFAVAVDRGAAADDLGRAFTMTDGDWHFTSTDRQHKTKHFDITCR